jgi:hypothetical protein
MKTYRSALLLPFNIPINTIRQFLSFGMIGVNKKSFIFAVQSGLGEKRTKCTDSQRAVLRNGGSNPAEKVVRN